MNAQHTMIKKRTEKDIMSFSVDTTQKSGNGKHQWVAASFLAGHRRHPDHINLFGGSDMAVKTVHQAGANENGRQNMAGRKRGARLYLILGQRMGWALCADNGQVSSGVQEFHPNADDGEGAMFMAFLEWLRQVRRECGSFAHVAYRLDRQAHGNAADETWEVFFWHLDIWVREHDIFLIGTSPVSISMDISGQKDAPDYLIKQALEHRGWHAEDEAEIAALALMVTMEEHPLWGGKRMLVVYIDSGEEMEHE